MHVSLPLIPMRQAGCMPARARAHPARCGACRTQAQEHGWEWMSPTRSLQAATAEQETSLLSGRSSGPLSTKGNAEAIEDGQGLFAQCCKCFALLPNKFFFKKNSATKSASGPSSVLMPHVSRRETFSSGSSECCNFGDVFSLSRLLRMSGK